MENLEYFFQLTKSVFGKILESDNWFVDSKMKDLANETWNEELQPKFEKLKDEVLAINSDDERLVQVGLSGKQLKFKLEVLKFVNVNNEKPTKKILGAINSVLSSLVTISPLAESIKEFKDFLELSGKNY